LPAWYLDEPLVDPILHSFYVGAFWQLDSERQISKDVIGKIPWTKAIDFAERVGFGEEMANAFWLIISEMDAGYLNWQKLEYQRAKSQSKKGDGDEEVERTERKPMKR